TSLSSRSVICSLTPGRAGFLTGPSGFFVVTALKAASAALRASPDVCARRGSLSFGGNAIGVASAVRSLHENWLLYRLQLRELDTLLHRVAGRALQLFHPARKWRA